MKLNSSNTASVASAARNIRTDISFVIGVQDAVTSLAERLCEEVGLRAHFAMKKSDKTKRVETLDEEAEIVPPLTEDETVLIVGLKAPHMLEDSQGGPLECNWSDNDASPFAFPLICFLVEAEERRLPVPEGWLLKDIPAPPSSLQRMDERWERAYRESECHGRRLGYFGPSGTVVADFGNGKQLLHLPQEYSSVFPLLEDKGTYC